MDRCGSCIHFENQSFLDKEFGYCKKIFVQIYEEDKDGNALIGVKSVTNVDFGCILFEPQIANNENKQGK